MSRKLKKRAFTLIELLVVVAIIALLISILLPSLSRARELSKRLVCQSNVKGQGTAYKIYANDNEENWPTPTFNEGGSIIKYVNDPSCPPAPATSTAFGVGCPRNFTINLTATTPNVVSLSSSNANQLSVTRAMFMLVRSGDVTPKQFVCPSSGDVIDPQQNIDLYYDFSDYKSVSYGFQVPYGPFATRASEALDPRMAVGADKGPWNNGGGAGGTLSPKETYNSVFDGSQDNGKLTPQQWRDFNSGNHGGKGTGEGQNVLYADGHASFEKTPIVGVDQDNIYTQMGKLAGLTAPKDVGDAILSGIIVSFAGNEPYPGKDVWLTGAGGTGTVAAYSTTDSLIYP